MVYINFTVGSHELPPVCPPTAPKDSLRSHELTSAWPVGWLSEHIYTHIRVAPQIDMMEPSTKISYSQIDVSFWNIVFIPLPLPPPIATATSASSFFSDPLRSLRLKLLAIRKAPLGQLWHDLRSAAPPTGGLKQRHGAGLRRQDPPKKK